MIVPKRFFVKSTRCLTVIQSIKHVNSAGTDAQNADNERMADERKAHGKTPVATPLELEQFINLTMGNRAGPYKRLKIGTVSESAKKQIWEKMRVTVKYINIDKCGIIHALDKAAHNLESDDLLHAADVINTSYDIELSQKRHKGCNVLEFKKDIYGEIKFLAEVHVKDGYLLVFDAWRKQKARRGTTADTDKGKPSANVRNESPHTDTSLSPSSGEKSSEKNAPDVCAMPHQKCYRKLPVPQIENVTQMA
jgi:hypothetical protein